jgi:tetratricopeptide (TPR) repeat protein
MKKVFTKKEIFKVKSKLIDPNEMVKPESVVDFQNRGMAYYAREQFDAAENDLRTAILMDESNIDSYYSLGMVLKALNHKDEAVQAFNQVLKHVKLKDDSDKTKNDMIRRLALGHINIITLGDWNLEKEIWQRIT